MTCQRPLVLMKIFSKIRPMLTLNQSDEPDTGLHEHLEQKRSYNFDLYNWSTRRRSAWHRPKIGQAAICQPQPRGSFYAHVGPTEVVVGIPVIADQRLYDICVRNRTRAHTRRIYFAVFCQSS